MCVVPKPSKLENTKIRVGKTRDGASTILAYQNDPEIIGEGQRVMLLPIPGEIVAIHDTTAYCDFLEETHQVCYADYEKDFAGARGLEPAFEKKMVVQKVGIYTVLHVNHPQLINEGLGLFPEEDRPAVAADFIDFYTTNYPDWSMILAVFSAKDKMASQPFLVEYKGEIRDNEGNHIFHVPALDNEKNGVHEGLPDIHATVSTDHFISMNVWREEDLVDPYPPLTIQYSQPVNSRLISDKVLYLYSFDRLENGDWFIWENGSDAVRTNLNLGRTLAALAS